MNVIHRGKLRHLELTFAIGDLFDAKVDAIVNSEQSDFVLSGNPDSISGQLWHRYGDTIQRELDDATNGQILGKGTVVETSGGGDFVRIFHAGFHEPDDWPGLGRSQEADYLESVGSCIRQILESARTQRLASLAFPLIGCGLFGLDEKMLILQFLDAVEILDERLKDGERLSVWLIIRDRHQFDSVAGVLFGLLLRHRAETVAIQLDRTGVEILDRFAARLARRFNEDWAKWQLCRLTEIAIEIMCYALCRATDPSPSPESLFREGMVASFGMVREHAMKFATIPIVNRKVWGTKFFREMLTDSAILTALEEVNVERNNLAHGRKSIAVAEVRKLVMRYLRLSEWSKISQTDGELRLEEWEPFVARSAETAQAGLLERWQKNAIRYLVPESGEVFKVNRKAVSTT
jgi:O-acetyl-ADP-ribose deacetylase (regulator of RNase III)